MINKILAFIKMPGWQPKELGGRLFAPSINQAYQKYNPPVPRSTSIYLIIQYVVIVGITSYFMFFGKPIVDDQTNPPSVIRTVYIAIYIILAITSVGLLLENKPFSLFVEYFRIACLAAMGWFFLNESYGLYAFAISLVLGLVSFIHFTILVLTKPKNLPVET
jgi:hypothetical protein